MLVFSLKQVYIYIYKGLDKELWMVKKRKVSFDIKMLQKDIGMKKIVLIMT